VFAFVSKQVFPDRWKWICTSGHK